MFEFLDQSHPLIGMEWVMVVDSSSFCFEEVILERQTGQQNYMGLMTSLIHC